MTEEGITRGRRYVDLVRVIPEEKKKSNQYVFQMSSIGSTEISEICFLVGGGGCCLEMTGRSEKFAIQVVHTCLWGSGYSCWCILNFGTCD